MTAAMNMTNSSRDQKVNPDHIGWLFVQQYYTFLNESPERLHLFYNRNSCFVHGQEGENVPTFLGQKDINVQIASLGFNQCKVFVSNVDSQNSMNGGVIVQVLGELSNNGEACHKFCQTFFLAEQPEGYFVLNDIFRYLKEDIDNAVEDEIEKVNHAPTFNYQEKSVPSPSKLYDQKPTNEVPTNNKIVHNTKLQSAAAPAPVKPQPTLAPKSQPTPQPVAKPHSESAQTTKDTHATQNGVQSAIRPISKPQAQTEITVEKVKSIPQKPVAVEQKTPVVTSKPTPSPIKPETKSYAAPIAKTTAPSSKPNSATSPIKSVAPVNAIPASAAPVPSSWSKIVASTTPATEVKSAVQAPVSKPVVPAVVPSKTQVTKAAKKDDSDKEKLGDKSVDGFHEVQGRHRGDRSANDRRLNEEKDKCTIYIRSVSESVDRQSMHEAFQAAFGPVVHVDIPEGKRIAFVQFANVEQAKLSIGKTVIVNGDSFVAEERRKSYPSRNNNNGNGNGPNQKFDNYRGSGAGYRNNNRGKSGRGGKGGDA
ncbi:hypothetical protein BC833DRAFT_562476 [Globomyces pollinis-pini]|nr:hypothetical protein BC833DRAFT_562476 [Globomyces pollinis-pini]